MVGDGTVLSQLHCAVQWEKNRVNGLLLHFNGVNATVTVLKTRNDIEWPNANTLFCFQRRLKATQK